jgi:CRISPR-associated protein Csc1
MPTVLDCHITLHDFTFFATREVGRLYETERALHNYALCYALGLAQSPYFIAEQSPRYRDDLIALNARGVYVTPARPVRVGFSLATWKYASNDYHVEMEKAQTNTPGFGRAKELAPESVFQFFIVCQDKTYRPPDWIRLGKWMSKAYVAVRGVHSIEPSAAREFQSPLLLNPLDAPPECGLLRCDVVNMPPVSLIQNAVFYGKALKVNDGTYLPSGLEFRFPKK